jgi:hypothetical protein
MAVHSTHTRDAAMRELRKINRWLIAASIILTGLLSDVAANAFPGKAGKASSAARGKSAGHHKHHPHAAKTGALRAPEQAPQSSIEVPAQDEAPAAAAQAPAEGAAEAAPAEAAPSAPDAQTEAAPVQEPEPAPEETGPVVSGGS